MARTYHGTCFRPLSIVLSYPCACNLVSLIHEKGIAHKEKKKLMKYFIHRFYEALDK